MEIQDGVRHFYFRQGCCWGLSEARAPELSPQSCPVSQKPQLTPDPSPGQGAQAPAARFQATPHTSLPLADFSDCCHCEGRVLSKPSTPVLLGQPSLTDRDSLLGWLDPIVGRAELLLRPRGGPRVAARVGRGRGRDKAAGRGPHLSSQKVQGECSGTPPGSGRSADSARPRGSPVSGGAAAGGSAMFSAGQAADARTRGPESLLVSRRQPRPAPRPARAGLGPAPAQQRPAGRPAPGTGDPREKGRGTVTRLVPQLEPRIDGRSGQWIGADGVSESNSTREEGERWIDIPAI